MKNTVKRLSIITCAFLFLIGFNVKAQKTDSFTSQNSIFPKGDKAPSNRFTGTVWVNMLVAEGDQLDCGVANVTFEPGARTYWHKHPGGQVLLVTDGTGYYQEKGKSIQLIRKGDAIKCLPGIEHWHGATPESTLTHIAIVTNTEKGQTVWLQEVPDAVYKSFK